ncbi:uncharacterized protein LOC129551940 [Moschus berezovskii]|uniref:uncharacterized protein LOC129551940 n=1 Tax=Moschus berezovskii TaxID=68408 RepID=UPI002444BE65|nr:uncharacterized protein LOC129551940 [Moschus berezovskii]
MRAPALLLVVLGPVMQVSSNLMLITRKPGETASFPCDLTQGATYIHLYKHEEGMAPRRLFYYDSYNSKLAFESGINGAKYHVYKGTGRSYTFAILNLEKSDSGIYYCYFSGWKKIFGKGANIIVTPPDRDLAADTSPKPTIFLPSIAEINHDNAGTYLCLLEKFFPDVITVSWRVKNDKRALPSQQGNTMKTNDTYMKFSWLTVTENSMDKQHVCVVKHKKNIGGIDQEIIFPSIKEVVASVVPTTEPPTTEPPTTEPPNDCLTDESGTLQLQLVNTSAYYTYLLLLLMSTVYFAVITSCVFRRTGVCCDGKISPSYDRGVDTGSLLGQDALIVMTPLKSRGFSPRPDPGAPPALSPSLASARGSTAGLRRAASLRGGAASRVAAAPRLAASARRVCAAPGSSSLRVASLASARWRRLARRVFAPRRRRSRRAASRRGALSGALSAGPARVCARAFLSLFTPVVTTTEPPSDCLKDESEVTDTDFTKACARDESEVTNSTKACLKDENNTVQLQFTYNSAYYTYLVLLLKSAIYFVITSFCVFRRTGVCCDRKSS